MKIRSRKNYSLKNHNTFGLEVKCDCFIEIFNNEELEFFLKHKNDFPKPFFIIGSGSNLLFTKDFKGSIIKLKSDKISIIEESKNEVLIEVDAGVVWDDFVDYAVENNFYGIENLKLIPGTVGACPVQNIGAYGVEVADTIFKVKAFFVNDAAYAEFTKSECNFEYRTSVFKTELKSQLIISAVQFKLKKNSQLNLKYGSIKEELTQLKILKPIPKDISKVVEKIRLSKLPDPDIIGNAGSFFKNPVISKAKFDELKLKYPDIVSFKLDSGRFKVAAAWMIDKLGWKGKAFGGAAVHENQALVLINKSNAKAIDIINLASKITEDVKSNFGISLEAEVNYI